jgi:hypothetical protein
MAESVDVVKPRLDKLGVHGALKDGTTVLA